MAFKVSMVYGKWGKLYTPVISSHRPIEAEAVLLRNMHYLCRKATVKWLLIKTYRHDGYKVFWKGKINRKNGFSLKLK